jgi:hypothetical protein
MILAVDSSVLVVLFFSKLSRISTISLQVAGAEQLDTSP